MKLYSFQLELLYILLAGMIFSEITLGVRAPKRYENRLRIYWRIEKIVK